MIKIGSRALGMEKSLTIPADNHEDAYNIIKKRMSNRMFHFKDFHSLTKYRRKKVSSTLLSKYYILLLTCNKQKIRIFIQIFSFSKNHTIFAYLKDQLFPKHSWLIHNTFNLTGDFFFLVIIESIRTEGYHQGYRILHIPLSLHAYNIHRPGTLSTRYGTEKLHVRMVPLE